MEKLELWVRDTSVTVVRHGHTILTVSITDAGLVHTFVPEASQENTLWEDTPSVNQSTLGVDIVTYEEQLEGSVALPTTKRQKIRPAAKAQPVVLSKSDTIDEQQKKRVLNAVLASLKKNPNQTKAEISAESHRIAEKYNVGVMAVAGVRANLTRGTYGNPKTLLRNT